MSGQAPQIPTAIPGQAPPVDLSGYWSPVLHEDLMERGAGSEIADYGGFPLNEAGRLWSLSYDPSRVTLRHHQCEAYLAPYQMRALGNFRIWEEREEHTQRLVAIHVWAQTTTPAAILAPTQQIARDTQAPAELAHINRMWRVSVTMVTADARRRRGSAAAPPGRGTTEDAAREAGHTWCETASQAHESHEQVSRRDLSNVERSLRLQPDPATQDAAW